MDPVDLSQVLLIYSGFALAAVVGFVILIARFYEHFSGQRTGYRWFTAPILLFGAGNVRYAGIDQVAGDMIGNLLHGIGGVILAVLIIRLYRKMTAQPPLQQ